MGSLTGRVEGWFPYLPSLKTQTNRAGNDIRDVLPANHPRRCFIGRRLLLGAFAGVVIKTHQWIVYARSKGRSSEKAVKVQSPRSKVQTGCKPLMKEIDPEILGGKAFAMDKRACFQHGGSGIKTIE